MEEISKDDAKKIFGNIPNTKPFVLSVIDHSQKVYTNTLGNFDNVLGFPWKDWELFHHLKEENLLSNTNKLCAMPLREIASNYIRILPSDIHTYRIERLKSGIVANGYSDSGDHLLVFEKDAPNKYYINDGMHRFIAYESLILLEKTTYTNPLKCVYAEVIDINNVLCNELFNVVDSIFKI